MSFGTYNNRKKFLKGFRTDEFTTFYNKVQLDKELAAKVAKIFDDDKIENVTDE